MEAEEDQMQDLFQSLIPHNICANETPDTSRVETFLALWPDEKVSIVQAPDLHSLYDKLETIGGDIDKCHIQRLNEYFKLCLTFKPATTIQEHRGDTIDDYCGEFPNAQMETMSRYEELLQTGDMSDVTVNTGSKQIKCHRLILSTQCPYFAGMFRSECSEAKKGEVHIEAFPTEVVETVIKYLYTGRVEVEKDTLHSYYKHHGDQNEESWCAAKIRMRQPFRGDLCGHCPEHTECSCEVKRDPLYYSSTEEEFSDDSSDEDSSVTSDNIRQAEVKQYDEVDNPEQVEDGNRNQGEAVTNSTRQVTENTDDSQENTRERKDNTNQGQENINKENTRQETENTDDELRKNQLEENATQGQEDTNQREQEDTNRPRRRGRRMKPPKLRRRGSVQDLYPDLCASMKASVDSVRMERLFWRDLYVAGDYFTLPTLQKIARVHLCSLCYRLKQCMKDPMSWNCKETQVMVKVIILLFQMGEELEGLSTLQTLACQLIRDYSSLDAKWHRHDDPYLQKAEYLKKVLPQEMKERILLPGDPKIFGTIRNIRCLNRIIDVTDYGIPESDETAQQLTHHFESIFKYGKAGSRDIDDINGLHLIANLCGQDNTQYRHVEPEEESTFYYAQLMSTLLCYGADINKTDRHGNTPLHVAAENLSPQLVSVLLKHDADATALNKSGKTPLEMAWQSFDRHVGIFANSTNEYSYQRNRILQLHRSKGYQKIAELLTEKMSLSDRPPRNNQQEAALQSVSSEFLEELLSDEFSPKFELVKDGGFFTNDFFSILWDKAYPDVAYARESAMRTGLHSNDMARERLKQLYKEVSVRDLCRANYPKFLSLATRIELKCGRIFKGSNVPATGPTQNCRNCTNILEGVEGAIPKEVLHLHCNLPRFWR